MPTQPSHNPREDFSFRGCLDVARWLADLKEEGIVRHVGLTNFDTQHLLEASLCHSSLLWGFCIVYC